MVTFMPAHPPIARFARFMALATLLAAGALPLLAAGVWLFFDHWAPLAVGNAGVDFDPAAVSAPMRLTAFLVSLAGAALQAYGLFGLRGAFLEAAEGRALSLKAVLGFRRFAWVAVAMVFVGIVQHAAYSAILTAGGPGEGQMSLRLGTNELSALFTGLLFVFVAHVFAEGRKAAEENASFL